MDSVHNNWGVFFFCFSASLFVFKCSYQNLSNIHLKHVDWEIHNSKEQNAFFFPFWGWTVPLNITHRHGKTAAGGSFLKRLKTPRVVIPNSLSWYFKPPCERWRSRLTAYLTLSVLLVSFSALPWVAPSSKLFLATRLPPAFTIDPEKQNKNQLQ